MKVKDGGSFRSGKKRSCKAGPTYFIIRTFVHMAKSQPGLVIAGPGPCVIMNARPIPEPNEGLTTTTY